jgi:LysM repeat protein
MPTPLSEVESTPTPLPSEEPQPTATPTLENPTHVVQEGENLLRIAERYGVTMQVIVERNGLANPDLIYIGQVLVIPLPAPPSPTPSG